MNMKLLFILILLAGLVIISPVAAKGETQVVRLVEKTAVDEGAYPIIHNGAFGMFQCKAGAYKFIGHKLAPVSYTLINYAEKWGSPVNVLGTGTPDNHGKLVITGSVDKFDYYDYVAGTPTSDEYKGQYGAKIWLVPSSDLTNDVFNKWVPENYLFETSLITPPADA